MSRFDYHQPESLADAVDLAARFGGEASFLAGGTDLIVQIERGRVAPRHVIGLGRVPGLAGIEVNGRITLGARVTHRAIEQTPALAGAAPLPRGGRRGHRRSPGAERRPPSAATS